MQKNWLLSAATENKGICSKQCQGAGTFSSVFFLLTLKMHIFDLIVFRHQPAICMSGVSIKSFLGGKKTPQNLCQVQILGCHKRTDLDFKILH